MCTASRFRILCSVKGSFGVTFPVIRHFALFLSVTALLYPSISVAQWVHAIASSEKDQIQGIAYTEDPSGPAIVAAGISSISGETAERNWVAKFGVNGDIIWSKYYDTTSIEGFLSIVPIFTNGYVTGYFASTSDGSIFQLHANGDVAFGCRKLSLQFSEIRIAPDGGIVAVGLREGVNNAYIIKTDPMPDGSLSCDIDWQYDLGPNLGRIYDIVISSDDSIVVSGFSEDGTSMESGVVYKFDVDGLLKWKRALANASQNVLHDVRFHTVTEAFDSDGVSEGFVVAGRFEDEADEFLDWINVYAVVSKLDNNGVDLWTTFIGYPLPVSPDFINFTQGRKVAQDPSGRFIVVGGHGTHPVLSQDTMRYDHMMLFVIDEEGVGNVTSPVLQTELDWFLDEQTYWPGLEPFTSAWAMDMTPNGGVVLGGVFDFWGDDSPSTAILARTNDDPDIPGCTVEALFEQYEFDYFWGDAPVLLPTGFVLDEYDVPAPEDTPIPRTICETCVRRVNKQSPAANPDGLTWPTSYTDIREAVWADFPYGPDRYCEVWVAQADDLSQDPETKDAYYLFDNDGYDTLEMRRNIHVYGGFAGHGTESDPLSPLGYGWETSRDDRDWESQVTVIDGRDETTQTNHVYHVVTGEDLTTLDGVVVRQGRANGVYEEHRSGGGLYCYEGAMVIENCGFYSNEASDYGGAIYSWGTELEIENCDFYYNHANDAGALANIATGNSVNNCYFKENTAVEWGGAVINYAWGWGYTSASTQNSEFRENSAQIGGALMNWNTASDVEDCWFELNEATEFGGAVWNYQTEDYGWLASGPSVGKSVFTQNYAGEAGGSAVANVAELFVVDSKVTVENCLMYRNTQNPNANSPYAGTILNYGWGNPTDITNCTIANNSNDLGITNVDNDVRVRNSIVWNNDEGGMWDYSSTLWGVMLAYDNNLPEDQWEWWNQLGWGDNNFGTSPLFYDEDNDFYWLTYDEVPSPCIDRADDAYAPLTDILGNSRVEVLDGGVLADVGAYEYQP